MVEKKINEVLVNDNGIRPAGPPDQCFFCGQKVGDPHAPTCVCLHRIVKVRYSFDIEIEVPHNWNKESIEFQKNESTWCANNALDELNEFAENLNGCLCPYFQAEVLEIPDAEPYRKNNQGRKIIN